MLFLEKNQYLAYNFTKFFPILSSLIMSYIFFMDKLGKEIYFLKSKGYFDSIKFEFLYSTTFMTYENFYQPNLSKKDYPPESGGYLELYENVFNFFTYIDKEFLYLTVEAKDHDILTFMNYPHLFKTQSLTFSCGYDNIFHTRLKNNNSPETRFTSCREQSHRVFLDELSLSINHDISVFGYGTFSKPRLLQHFFFEGLDYIKNILLNIRYGYLHSNLLVQCKFSFISKIFRYFE